MTDAPTMLEQHVAFELARWRGELLPATLHEEVDAAVAWFGTLTVADLGPAEELARGAARWVDELPVTDELLALVAEVAAVGHEALLAREEPLAAVVAKAEYDGVARVLSEADGVWAEVLDLVTTSEAYSRLVAHVLYHGVKSYVLTENVLAKKIPGASSLVKLGQRSLHNAAPNLEATLDRQLTAFVRTNITETLRESRRYLGDILDPAMVQEMAADGWEALGERSLASLAGTLASPTVNELAERVGRLVRTVHDSGVVGRLVEDIVGTMLERHAQRRLADVLSEHGLPADELTSRVTAVLLPLVERADADGFLEERVRARLTPFYESLE